MPTAMKTLEVKVERTIPASRAEVFDAWLNPKVPGTPWCEGDKTILDPKVDGLFYWLMRGKGHYGRFTELARPVKIQHTWVSPHTLGDESTVTVTFEQKAEDTLMTIIHTGLPDNDLGKGHEQGWSYFMSKLANHFGGHEKVEPIPACD